MVAGGRDPEWAHRQTRPLREESQAEPPLELGRSAQRVLVELRVPHLVEENPERCHEPEHSHAEELGRLRPVSHECHGGPRDRRHEREQLEADIEQGAQQLGRLVVVEPVVVRHQQKSATVKLSRSVEPLPSGAKVWTTTLLPPLVFAETSPSAMSLPPGIASTAQFETSWSKVRL